MQSDCLVFFEHNPRDLAQRGEDGQSVFSVLERLGYEKFII